MNSKNTDQLCACTSFALVKRVIIIIIWPLLLFMRQLDNFGIEVSAIKSSLINLNDLIQEPVAVKLQNINDKK